MEERSVLVSGNEVRLRLTLGPRLLGKSFEEAVVLPFIKAYNKRAPLAVAPHDLLGVRIDGEPLRDVSLGAGVVLLQGETVHAELSFRAPLDPSLELPSNPFQSPTDGGKVPSVASENLVNFDGEDRSEINRIKAGASLLSRLDPSRTLSNHLILSARHISSQPF